jgi:hypothetical protein
MVILLNFFRKTAQDVTGDLREIDLLYEDPFLKDSDDPARAMKAQIYSPVIRLARWIPEEASDDDHRVKSVGMSYLASPPEGTPRPQEFEKWIDKHIEFIYKVNKKFSRWSMSSSREEWKKFTKKTLPQSDSVFDYAEALGSVLQPPLGRYLYGSNPSGFWVRTFCHTVILSYRQTISRSCFNLY